jgi:hypothetical protein
MAEEFVNYKSFNDKAVAMELYEKLRQEGVPVEWESSVGIFDVSFANDEFMHLYYVKLRKQDFERADAILMEFVKQKNEKPKEGYYLYSFSNEELIDVLKNPLEWNEYDRYWAGRLLQERNIAVREEEFAYTKTENIDELRKPWKASKIWLLLPLVLFSWALYTVYFFPAALCIFIGAYIAFSKKTLPNGDRVRAFSDDNWFLGILVMVAGILFTTFCMLFYFDVIPIEWIFWPSLW